MSNIDTSDADRAALLDATGYLAVSRDPAGQARGPDDPATELFLLLDAQGRTNALNGHVDLGQGIRTALAQIVAEELDLAFERVTMLLGNVGTGPDQGGTIASETIQVTAPALRAAAAQARNALLTLAAEALEARAETLTIRDGVVTAGDNRFVTYAELLQGRRIHLELDRATPTKPAQDYRIVGQSIARTDIPSKVTADFAYIHDLRLPGMLHGRVVRPPYAGIDAGDFVGTSLIAVDAASVADIPGLVGIVTIRDFVGVVCEREEHAILAAERLKVEWKPTPALPDLASLETALRANPSTPRVLKNTGDVDAAIAGAATPMQRHYIWPYHMHGSLGPSCGVAAPREDGGITVWTGSQNPHWLHNDLAQLLDLPKDAIDLIRMEAAGCYGRNCADDVSADAALMARAIGRPVRVQLTREQEHAWEPKGPAQLMDVNGGLDANGTLIAYDFQTRFPGNKAPTLALILTGTISPVAIVGDVGDRTAIPPYDVENMRVTVLDMPPIVRASWLRGVAAMPNTFAHESYMDEMAAAAGVDPVEFRLRHLRDPRAIDLIHATTERANWQPRPTPRHPAIAQDGLLHGRGFAYGVYVHGTFPGTAAAWSAWVVDVAVDPASGEVAVTRVTAGQDSGLMINPAGVRHQLHGNVIQSTSRVLKEQVTFDKGVTTSNEWGAYPIITFPEVPKIDVLLMPRQDQPPVGAGESASVPSAAAIANAIFDATGVRFREVPFTPDRIRAGLRPNEPAFAALAAPAPAPKKRRFWAGLFSGLVGAGGLALAALPWRPAIAPIAQPDPAAYSPGTIERGRVLAALGDCAVCHTAEGGITMAGGRILQTPFGPITVPNLTPDVQTGIGGWSYPAFERAMRDGIGRDGRHLYPAFPYTNFTRTSDADLQAIYAYLMAQPAVPNETPPTKLSFPFSMRPLLAGWNALFHKPGPITIDAAQSPQWNRGAYLVEGLGHCDACHSPRNALGAVQGGEARLAGAMVEGWEAPALTSLSRAPVPWTEDELFAYLRTGQTQFHGVAAGNMAPVVTGLAEVPDADIRAMAVYLASFNDAAATSPATIAADVQAKSDVAAKGLIGATGQRIFDGACAVCHAPGAAGFGARPNLAFNTNLHSERPDNLLRVILDGVADPALPELGVMPGFGGSLTDEKIIELTRYLRARFAPGEASWGNIEGTLARLRAR